MIITNRFNMPPSMVRCLTNDNYSNKADYSVTEILQPPLLRKLRREHDSEIVIDVTDNAWKVFGTAVHNVVSGQADDPSINVITEEYVSVPVMLPGGKRVTLGGTFDHLEYVEGKLVLTDHKTGSINQVRMEGAPKREWVEQLNIYRYLLRDAGFKVDQMQVLVWLKDWSKNQAKVDPEYPPCVIHRYTIPAWPYERVEAFIAERILLHEQAAVAGVEGVSICSESERWVRDEKWAIMKKGRKRAVKLHDTAQAALDHKAELDSQHYIQHRPGVDIRCQSWCLGAPWCPYGSKYHTDAAVVEADAAEQQEVA